MEWKAGECLLLVLCGIPNNKLRMGCMINWMTGICLTIQGEMQTKAPHMFFVVDLRFLEAGLYISKIVYITHEVHN